jgi:Transglutaminase-like superfamily
MRPIVATPRVLALSARMAAWVVAVSILVRITSLPRVERIVSCRLRSRTRVPVDRGDSTAPRKQTHAHAAHLATTIDRLLRLDLFVFQRCCWKRALVLHRFLALRGIESRVTFGVMKDADGTMRGHAWLEHEGRPLLEDDAAGYVVTFTLPGLS